MQTVCKVACAKKKQATGVQDSVSFLPGILIALIPKCPFCILSFTSAITVCSSKTLPVHDSNWTSYISIAFSVLTAVIVAYNYKGVKTQFALATIGLGIALIVYSELYSGLLQSYYWGSAFLIVGVWINGSLEFFIRKFKSILKVSNSTRLNA